MNTKNTGRFNKAPMLIRLPSLFSMYSICILPKRLSSEKNKVNPDIPTKVRTTPIATPIKRSLLLKIPII